MKRKQDLEEPCAKRDRHIIKYGKVGDEFRGVNVMDPPILVDDYYYWLKDETRTNKDVLEHIKKENKYTEQYMADTIPIQTELMAEMKSRIIPNDTCYPYQYGLPSQYQYYWENEDGKGYKIYYRKSVVIECLLDVNEIAKNKKYCEVSNVIVSPDHKILSYGVDYKGDEKFDIRFKDIDNDCLLSYKINSVIGADYIWGPDSQTIFYMGIDNCDRAYQVWLYNLKDLSHILLFEEPDSTFSLEFSLSEDNKWILIQSISFDSDKCYYANINIPDKFHQITSFKNSKCCISIHHDNILALTNFNNMTNFSLYQSKLSEINFVEVKTYNKDEYLTDILCFNDFIVISLRKNGFSNLAIISYKDGIYGEWDYLKFDEDIFSISLDMNEIYDTNKLRFNYTSLICPNILYEYDMITKKLEILQEKHVPNYNPNLYESNLIWVPSFYGQRVPVSIIYRKDLCKNKPVPFYLFGYGAYGLCVDPLFDSKRISLLDRGFIWGIAHIRGGGELGYDYYLDGKMYNKMNTFLDFITVSEWLIREKYTRPDLLVIEGRSAGGLLICAVMNMRPDLFKVVIAGVPFCDVLNSMSDPSLHLTIEEWSQWGNSNNQVDYNYMMQYVPYENIRNIAYPHTLFLTGFNDPRVGYWEALKFVAKMRYYKTDNNSHLVKISMEQGHFGDCDRYKMIEEKAYQYAYVIKNLNK